MDQRVLSPIVRSSIPTTHMMKEEGTNSCKLSFGCHVIKSVSPVDIPTHIQNK